MKRRRIFDLIKIVTSVPYFPKPGMPFDTMHGPGHYAWPLSLPGYNTGYAYWGLVWGFLSYI